MAAQATLTCGSGWTAPAFNASQLTSLNADGSLLGLAAWDGRQYQVRTLSQAEVNANLALRRGFWIYCDSNSGGQATYNGPIATGEQTTSLFAGWNMLNFATTQAVPASSMKAHVNGQAVPLGEVVLPTFYRINADNTYTAVNAERDVLDGRFNYWVFVSGNVGASGTVTVAYSPTPGATPGPGGSPGVGASPVATPGPGASPGGPGPGASPGATPGPGVTPTPLPNVSPTPVATGPLDVINDVREAAGLEEILENPLATVGANLHAVFQLLNNVVTHGETGGVGATAQGALAGSQSNLVVSTTPNIPLAQTVSDTLNAAFHGLGLLDPVLNTIGLGYASNPLGLGLKTSVVLNVLGDRSGTPPTLPAFYPGQGVIVNVTTSAPSQTPNPVPGHSGLLGIPIYVLVGSTPNVSECSLLRIGVGNVACVSIDETSYTNPDPTQQALGRSILSRTHGLCILALEPLVPGASYQVRVRVNGILYVWVFGCAPTATPSGNLLQYH